MVSSVDFSLKLRPYSAVNVLAAGEAGPGPGALETCAALASQVIMKVANAESGTWKAMNQDGLSGDYLTQAAAATVELLPPGDPVRDIIVQADENQRRVQEGGTTVEAEAFDLEAGAYPRPLLSLT